MSETHRRRSDESRGLSTASTLTVDLPQSPIARLADPVLAFDEARHIVYVNPAFEKLYGWEANELIGQPTRVLIPKQFRRKQSDVRVDRTGEGVLLHKDGAVVPIERRVSPLETTAGVILVALIVDISERKLREQTLVARVKELERQLAERTTELREQEEDHQVFANAASHDLQGPLRTMRGYAQALLDNHAGTMDPPARKFAAQIVDEAKSMEALIGRLLTYNRVAQATAKVAPVNMMNVFHETLAYLDGNIRDSGAQVTIIDGDLKVMGHDAMITPILINLISNAIKFTRPGQAPQITLGARREGDFVRVWVEDHGIGIAAKDRARIFQIFERLDGSQFPGSGIGLAIVKKAVERMHGQVGVESKLGKGSLFWVTLPAA